MQLLECIPNLSEGRDPQIISQFAEAIKSVEGVKLLHTDTGMAAHRTVFTFVGQPEAVTEAAFRLYQKSVELIDMGQHTGTHPRQAAVDVCPLVPLRRMGMNDCINLAYRLGHRVGEELGIPGYFYGFAASQPEKMNLAYLRRGGYEALPKKFETLPPDFGKAENWQRSGATVIGCRKLLIAYNVNLNTRDVKVARQIAENLRESGKTSFNERGEKTQVRGRLKSVKGLGWYIDDFKKAQVSYNLTDTDQAGMLDVFLATREEAAKLGFSVTGSELVGLAPLSEFIKAGRYFLKDEQAGEKEAVDAAIRFLGLDELKPFEAEKKVLDLLLQEVGF